MQLKMLSSRLATMLSRAGESKFFIVLPCSVSLYHITHDDLIEQNSNLSCDLFYETKVVEQRNNK